MDSSLEVHVDVCALYMCVQRGLGRGGDKKCVQPNKLTYLIISAVVPIAGCEAARLSASFGLVDEYI